MRSDAGETVRSTDPLNPPPQTAADCSNWRRVYNFVKKEKFGQRRTFTTQRTKVASYVADPGRGVVVDVHSPCEDETYFYGFKSLRWQKNINGVWITMFEFAGN